MIWRHSSHPVYHCSNKQLSGNVLSFFGIWCYRVAYWGWGHIFHTVLRPHPDHLHILLPGHQFLCGDEKAVPISEGASISLPPGWHWCRAACPGVLMVDQGWVAAGHFPIGSYRLIDGAVSSFKAELQLISNTFRFSLVLYSFQSFPYSSWQSEQHKNSEETSYLKGSFDSGK